MKEYILYFSCPTGGNGNVKLNSVLVASVKCTLISCVLVQGPVHFY